MKHERGMLKTENAINEILNDRPYFNSIKFLDTARIKMIAMYRALKDDNFDFIENFCDSECVNKLKTQKDSLFILDDDIDFLSVQSRYIIEYRRNKDFDEIDVNFHTFHVDYMKNNAINNATRKKKIYRKNI